MLQNQNILNNIRENNALSHSKAQSYKLVSNRYNSTEDNDGDKNHTLAEMFGSVVLEHGLFRVH